MSLAAPVRSVLIKFWMGKCGAMDEDLAKLVGHRVRFSRTVTGRTRIAVAGLTGITPDYLYQIERG